MKVAGSVSAQSSLKAKINIGKTEQIATRDGKTGFQQWLGEAKNRERFKNLIDEGGHREINSFQKQLLSGKQFESRDLLLYQIKVSQFAMRVELLSKVAESANSTLKRFQSGQ